MRNVLVAVTSCIVLGACASTQLNSNTLDLASSSESLITSQVLYNLAKFRSSPNAIPAQVSIPSGSATTTNAVTPTVGGAIGPSLTTSLANTAAAPAFFATSKTHLNPNSTVSVSVGDQWSQNWTLTPLTDPDQLRRLRALYRYGAGWTGTGELACEYPLVQKAGSGGSSSQTVNVYVNGAKVDKDPGNQGGDEKNTYTLAECIKQGRQVKVTQVDPAFVKLPGCVLCADSNKNLYVNESLKNGWLWKPDTPSPDGDPIRLGGLNDPDLYLQPRNSCSRLSPPDCSKKEFNDFILFILEATLESSASGGTKGSTQKPGAAPGLLQEKAAPQIQLLQ
jgi:hypothetical protein